MDDLQVVAAAEDPEKLRRELEDKLAAGRSPFPRAEFFGVDDLIDPRDTRSIIAFALSACHNKEVNGTKEFGTWRM